MFWGIVIFLFFILMMIGASGAKKVKEKEALLGSQGYIMASKIDVSKYISGHPDIDKPYEKVYILINQNDNDLHFWVDDKTNLGANIKIGVIKKDAIKNVIVEDATTIEKRVTVGRLLLVGVFAFALKKKEKNELSYLIIEWNDGKFDHETIFEFDGKDSITRNNTARNQIIRAIR